MIDRIPVNILENGAIKYGIYDENGTLLRYEYIKNEDGAVTTGTALNKANLLSDTVAVAIKSATEQANNPDTVSSAFAQIAGVIGTNGVRIATGSYTGTGAHGTEAEPCSITLDFAPKILMIFTALGALGEYSTSSGGVNQAIGFTQTLTEEYVRNALWTSSYYNYGDKNGYAKKSNGGKTISWYNEEAAVLNGSATTYYFVAIA